MQRSRAEPQSHKIDKTSSKHFNWRAGEKGPTDERQQEPADEPNAAIKNIVPCAYARVQDKTKSRALPAA